MILRDLLAEVERLHPHAESTEVARFLLLLTLRDPSLQRFARQDGLEKEIRDIQLRIQATTDQHSAVADELDKLASNEPCEFSPDHLWTLIRAIKVQSHILEMYLDVNVHQVT